MKVQVVILRALAKKITSWQAAGILGISDRHMRRWRERYEEFGYDGLYEPQGWGKPQRGGCRGRKWSEFWNCIANGIST
jgi:hypothetical protein